MNSVLNYLISSAVGLLLPFYTFLGAFILYTINRLNGNQPFSLCTVLNVKMATASTVCILFDMVVSSLLGSLVVIPLTSPETVPQAIAAGLGMTGVFSAYNKPTPPKVTQESSDVTSSGKFTRNLG